MRKLLLVILLASSLVITSCAPAAVEHYTPDITTDSKIIEFPEGTTVLTEPIQYSDFTAIRGQGSKLTILDASGLDYGIMPAPHNRQIYGVEISGLTIIYGKIGIWLRDVWQPKFFDVECTEQSDIGLLMDGGEFGCSGLLALGFFATEGNNGIVFGVSEPTGFLSINKFIGGGSIGHVYSSIVIATPLGAGAGQGIANNYFEAFQIECAKWGARIGDSGIGVSNTVFMNCFWDTCFEWDLMNFGAATGTKVIVGLIHEDNVYEEAPITWIP